MIQVGDTYSWTPTSYEGASGITEIRGRGKLTVHGRVIYINERHRYFTAEADANGCKIRESFKFQEGKRHDEIQDQR